MRILITGGSGFIGSHLTRALKTEGHSVVIADREAPGLYGPVGDVVVHELNLAEQSLTPCMPGVDVLINLASTLGIRYGIDHPLQQLDNNLRTTRNVLDAALAFGVRVIHGSSSAVYGSSRSSKPIKETDELHFSAALSRSSNYAFSKLGQEVLMNAYREQFGLNVQIIRFFNCIGGGQRSTYGHVLPSFIEAAMVGSPLRVHGDGSQRRSFMHISDTVNAILCVIDHFEQGGVYNIGGVEEISINDLAERVVELTGSTSEIEHVDNSTAFCRSFEEPLARVPDIGRIRSLGFQPLLDLRSAVEQAIAETNSPTIQVLA